MLLNISMQAKLFLLFCVGLLVTTSSINAQDFTKVKGVVIDAETKEPLPFVNVGFAGTTIGTTTDFDGNYELESQYGSDQIFASFLGYESDTIKIELGKKQKVDFALQSTALNLNTVTVTAEKRRYRKRNNPAVELMRKVIKNKKKNRLESLDYYEHDQYEKVELDLNNISDKFRNRKALRKFQFIFEYVDTSEINGKPYLPFFLQETASTVYYRKSPKTTREHVKGQKVTGLDGYLDEGSIAAVTDLLYQNLDIYDNNMNFLTKQFVSPLSVFAVDFYKFYIIDTIDYNGQQVVDMAFLTRNKLDFGFKGNIYIALDSTYRVVKAEMGIGKDINLNFVEEVRIVQEFSEQNGEWVLTKDDLIVDYVITKKGMGVFGRRSVMYDNFVFNKKQEDWAYAGTEKEVEQKGMRDRDEAFWEEARPVQLTEQEKGVYQMIDTLQQVPAFKRALNLLTLIFTGYTDIGAIDIGPINAFYSFNDIEGFRMRLGGRTNLKFNEKLQLEGYGAYGFRDKEFKYYASGLYSFNENFQDQPRHYVQLSRFHETKFPGQILEYVTEDNFLLSFRRGAQDRMLFLTTNKVDYFHEMKNNFGYHFAVETRRQEPLGSLTFDYVDEMGEPRQFADLSATELRLNLQYSPNAQYWNTKNFRYNLYNKYPILKLFYSKGVKALGGDYDYHKMQFNVFKRFQFSILGYANVEAEVGKAWGDGIPYVMLFLPRANQTFSYQHRAYNMMNFLEFVSDQYVSLNIRYYFEGFFFNKIPLLRKLKLREVSTFKLLYGNLRDANNPNITPNLVQFSETAEGVPETYSLSAKPYMEWSVGISNIFKLLRIDVIKRLTYLDHPETPELWGVKGLGIRARAALDF
ncbi:MAG: DUF5686 family protein [Bacteroidota bacterium]